MTALSVHGLSVPIRQDEVSDVIWAALRDGSYEAKEARWAVAAARPGDRILELGAGIGVITALLAGVADVQVWAYEADPASAALARRVVAANGRTNVSLRQGILAAGGPRQQTYYRRRDLWMSSLVEGQGPYDEVLQVTSEDVDEFLSRQPIDLLVMDIEGAELDLTAGAALPGVERVFLELHDHLYGLDGIQKITTQLASKGFAYDPRGSRGACVLFSRNRDPREYEPEMSDG
ncbi:FkbM family methyltransferase [Inquilinus limosus]|uniref:FkbM family methyltransferase n=1 Tax=Inquilinus limosus TaxID=171674 RepID=UPI00047B6E7B|nr:FkbM family methyltransferase [Inquilinus limosus]